jgi:hypothetical protein
MGRMCRKHGKKRNAYKISVRISEGKTPPERARFKREDTIKIYVK